MTRFFYIFSFSRRAQHRTKSQHLQVLPYDYSISILFVTICRFLHYRAQYFFFFCHIFSGLTLKRAHTHDNDETEGKKQHTRKQFHIYSSF